MRAGEFEDQQEEMGLTTETEIPYANITFFPKGSTDGCADGMKKMYFCGRPRRSFRGECHGMAMAG